MNDGQGVKRESENAPCAFTVVLENATRTGESCRQGKGAFCFLEGRCSSTLVLQRST